MEVKIYLEMDRGPFRHQVRVGTFDVEDLVESPRLLHKEIKKILGRDEEDNIIVFVETKEVKR